MHSKKRCDEVHICIRQHANFEHFQQTRHSTNVIMQIHGKVLVLKVNSFSNNNKQVIHGNNTVGSYLSTTTTVLPVLSSNEVKVTRYFT